MSSLFVLLLLFRLWFDFFLDRNPFELLAVEMMAGCYISSAFLRAMYKPNLLLKIGIG